MCLHKQPDSADILFAFLPIVRMHLLRRSIAALIGLHLIDHEACRFKQFTYLSCGEAVDVLQLVAEQPLPDLMRVTKITFVWRPPLSC